MHRNIILYIATSLDGYIASFETKTVDGMVELMYGRR